MADDTPVGVAAALRHASDPSFVPRPTLLEKELSLEGKVAIVTGGHRGLGLEMAEALAEAGAVVYCVATSASPNANWKAVQTYVSKLGLKTARLEYTSLDVSDPKATNEVIDKIVEKEGQLDVVVASAGVVDMIPCLDVTPAQFEKVMDINANGLFYTAQASAKHMKRLGIHGSIVLVTSISGHVALQGAQTIAYGCSKGAGLQMARSLACELAPLGIRVNSLSPGYFPTEMVGVHVEANPALGQMVASQNPMGRLGKTSELRGIIAWLASDSSTFCTGSDILVDGGHRAW